SKHKGNTCSRKTNQFAWSNRWRLFQLEFFSLSTEFFIPVDQPLQCLLRCAEGSNQSCLDYSSRQTCVLGQFPFKALGYEGPQLFGSNFCLTFDNDCSY